MNNTFDWNRFRKLVAMDLRSIWAKFGMTLLIITLLPIAAWLLFTVLAGTSFPIAPEFRWAEILGLALLCACMAPSRMYRTCNLPKEGIYFAMLPASKLEKYLSMWLICGVVCPLLCLAGGVVLDLLLSVVPGCYSGYFWQLDNLQIIKAEVMKSEESRFVAEMLFSFPFVLNCVLQYLVDVAVFMFTATIFKKHKVLQTILWLWLISFVIQIVSTPFLGAMAVNNPQWIVSLFETPEGQQHFISMVLWGSMVFSTAWLILFVWWTGRRLNRMHY